MAQNFLTNAKNNCKVDGKVIEVTLLTQTCQHCARSSSSGLDNQQGLFLN